MSEEFEALLQQGKDQQKAGQYSEALKTFSYLIKYYPQSDEAYYNRGNVRKDQGDLDGAIALSLKIRSTPFGMA